MSAKRLLFSTTPERHSSRRQHPSAGLHLQPPADPAAKPADPHLDENGSQHPRPRLSIVTASCNHAPLIQGALRSVASQAGIVATADVEHLIYDGLSTDGAAAVYLRLNRAGFRFHHARRTV